MKTFGKGSLKNWSVLGKGLAMGKNVLLRGTRMDANIPRVWKEKIAPSFDAKKQTDLSKLDVESTDLLMKTKGIGAYLGWTSPAFAQEMLRTPVKSFFNAAISSNPWIGLDQSVERKTKHEEQLKWEQEMQKNIWTEKDWDEYGQDLHAKFNGIEVKLGDETSHAAGTLQGEKFKIDGSLNIAQTLLKEAQLKNSPKADIDVLQKNVDSLDIKKEEIDAKISKKTEEREQVLREKELFDKKNKNRMTVKDGKINVNGKEFDWLKYKTENKKIIQGLDDVEKAIQEEKYKKNPNQKKLNDLERKKADFELQRQAMPDIKESVVIGGAGLNEKEQKAEVDSLKEKVNKNIADYMAKVEDANKSITRYRKFTSQTNKAIQTLVNKAESELATEDSQELQMMYDKAIMNHDEIMAAAIMKKLSKNFDMNDLMERYGYNEKAGMNKQEKEAFVKKLKGEGKTDAEIQRRIMEERGYKDFIRERYMEPLGLSEQAAFATGSMLSGIHKANNEVFGMETIGIADDGSYYQRDRLTQQEMATVHIGKQDKETLLRKGTRHIWGGKNFFTGEWELNESGAAFLIENVGKVIKETANDGRLAANTAKLLAQTMDTFEKIIPTVEKTLQPRLKKMARGLKEFARTAKAGQDLSAQMKELNKFLK